MNRRTFRAALLFWASIAGVSDAQLVPQRVTTGTRDIVNLTFAGATLGRVPGGIQLLQGNVDVVDKDGQRMLRASSRTTFLVSLPEVLPLDFTLEFDVIPKTCCMPEDIGFEGTPAIDQGAYSSNVLIHREWLAVVGGGAHFDQKIPEATAVTLPGVLTKVTVEFQGETMRLLINGQVMHTLLNRKFVRGRVLRVFLGGQDSSLQAVYLAGLRVAAGVNSGVVAATQPLNPAASTPAPLTAVPVNTTATATPITQPTTAAGPLTPPTRSPTTPTALGTGPAPTNLMAYGTPSVARLRWNAVPGATGYSVNRALTGTMSSVTITSTNITTTDLARDVLPDPTRKYTYTVLAYQADGTYGQSSVDYVAPQPTDPSPVTAVSTQPGVVELSWSPTGTGADFLVMGPGIPPNTTTPGTGFTQKFVVPSVPAGVHTYRVASVYPPSGTMTPAASWPSATVTVAPAPTVPFLTVPNGPGSLAEYNRHACAAGQWLSGQQAWVNTWCSLPTAQSIADVRALPVLSLFGIQEYQPLMGNDLLTGADFDLYAGANEWTTFSLWRWAQGGRIVPEASFHDITDLDRGRRVGCVQRGSAAAASTLCWALSTPGVLSAIVQSQQETSFLLFTEVPHTPATIFECPEPPNWWDWNSDRIPCGRLMGVPSTTMDSRGNRFAPHACIACHGGRFDPATGKVTGASLLPLDPRNFTFSGPNGRSGQEETIRQINMMIFNSQASTLVRNYITDMYRGRQTVIGAVVDDSYVPPAWASQPAVYRDVYRPYCASCHNAQTGTLGFTGWADLVREKVRVQHAVCNTRSMPHAEVPFNTFWNDGGAAKWPGVLMAALGLPNCP